jgi:hypothetical protein
VKQLEGKITSGTIKRHNNVSLCWMGKKKHNDILCFIYFEFWGPGIRQSIEDTMNSDRRHKQ